MPWMSTSAAVDPILGLDADRARLTSALAAIRAHVEAEYPTERERARRLGHLADTFEAVASFDHHLATLLQARRLAWERLHADADMSRGGPEVTTSSSDVLTPQDAYGVALYWWRALDAAVHASGLLYEAIATLPEGWPEHDDPDDTRRAWLALLTDAAQAGRLAADSLTLSAVDERALEHLPQESEVQDEFDRQAVRTAQQARGLAIGWLRRRGAYQGLALDAGDPDQWMAEQAQGGDAA
jgi:hypothetical protein